MIRHHLDPIASRASWSRTDAVLPDVGWLNEIDLIVQHDLREMARYNRKLDISPKLLTDGDIRYLVAFLHSLTGKSVRDTPMGRPDTVPSGLPVD